MESLLK